jgi:hypothetical protein
MLRKLGPILWNIVIIGCVIRPKISRGIGKKIQAAVLAVSQMEYGIADTPIYIWGRQKGFRCTGAVRAFCDHDT